MDAVYADLCKCTYVPVVHICPCSMYLSCAVHAAVCHDYICGYAMYIYTLTYTIFFWSRVS